MPRTVRVEPCMGTVFTFDLRDGADDVDGADWTFALESAVAMLHRVDATFSTYRDDSDISRIRRGELRLADAHPDVREVLGRCADAQLASRGAFTALYDGRPDPTGLVKGWAIDEAARVLRQHGCADFAVNGGGDVLTVGEAAPGRPWGVGIVDPQDRSRVLETVSVRDLAVATSGTAERGAHIVDPFTGRPATSLLSATVVGPTMAEADAYATAAFVLGADALRWIEAMTGFEAMLVAADGSRAVSTGWDSLVATPAAAAGQRAD